MGIIAALIIGGIAGWLAGLIVQGFGFGLIWNIVIGIVGAFIGVWLGGAVYDGIWVGENSRVPNTGGIRTALVEALRRIKAPVIRWPGGCFADSYDWRDGTGPRPDRPRDGLRFLSKILRDCIRRGGREARRDEHRTTIEGVE